jgi:hypothetical protein
MTSRGRGNAPCWPIGSVAEKVISSAPVPVMLVPTHIAPDVVAPVVDDFLRRELIGAI